MTTPEAASPAHALAELTPLKGAAPPARQSRIRGARLVAALAVAMVVTGCALSEPWVKPHERERLADPIMQPAGGDMLAAKHSQHVRDIREGARGANGVQGGGCGCK
jgi:hypothetical protein